MTAVTHQAKVTGIEDTEEMNQVINIAELCGFTRMEIDYTARSSVISIEVLWDRNEYGNTEDDEDMTDFDIQVSDLGFNVEWSEI